MPFFRWSLSGTTKEAANGIARQRPILTPAQSRMARAALQWSLEDAGAAAGVSRRTVLRFENDHRDIQPDLIAALRRAFEAAGVRFTAEGGVNPPA